MAKKAYQDYSSIEEIIIVNPDTLEVKSKVSGNMEDTKKITLLTNALFQVYNGVIYFKESDSNRYSLYKGIGGKKSFPDAKESI